MTQEINQRMNRSEWAVLIFLAIIWGGSFFFIKLSLHSFPPLTLVLLRTTIAGIALYIILRVTGRRLPRSPGLWMAFLILGILNIAAPFALFAWSQTHISAGLASILNATTPLWGVAAGHVLTSDEKATPGKLAGVAVGIAGVAIMIGGDALSGLGDQLMPQIACLAAAASYALASLYGRRFRGLGIGPMEVSAGQIITSAILLLPMALFVDRPWQLPAPGSDSIVAITLLALVCTSFAYILYFRLLETAGATNSLLVTFLVPVTAILLGTMVLGETLEPKHWVGMSLIALGLAAIDGRPFNLLRARQARQSG